MLAAFLERGGEDRTELFADTHVWSLDGGRLRAHFQRYPIISLTFKDIKRTTWADSWALVRRSVQDEVARLWTAHDLAHDADPRRLHRYAQMVAPDATPTDLATMLPELSGWLVQRTGERAVVLIDEYDAPLHAAWEHGYWDAAIAFFRTFLASGLKDEANVFRGVLTGILKVARANIFSGLNNVDTSSLFEPRHAAHFGFTADEVAALAERGGQADAVDGMREWYAGYPFGGTRPVTIYTPWSLLQYLDKPTNGFQSPRSTAACPGSSTRSRSPVSTAVGRSSCSSSLAPTCWSSTIGASPPSPPRNGTTSSRCSKTAKDCAPPSSRVSYPPMGGTPTSATPPSLTRFSTGSSTTHTRSSSPAPLGGRATRPPTRTENQTRRASLRSDHDAAVQVVTMGRSRCPR